MLTSCGMTDETSAKRGWDGDFEEHGVVCFRGDQANRYAGSTLWKS